MQRELLHRRKSRNRQFSVRSLQVVNVQRKNMDRALYPDPLHALALLESHDRSRWKAALVDLREKVFPGPYTSEFLGFDGLRVLLGVAERIIESEDTETGPVLRSEVNSELNFCPNFEGLVLGCIDADFCK